LILSCPSCAAQFNVDPHALGEAGRTVRCGKCKHQWHATRPLITMPADDLTYTAREEKAAGVSTAAPEAEGIAQNSIEQSNVTQSNFTRATFTQAAMNEEDNMASLPAFSSDVAPIAKRNAVIAAILLASLLSIPIFMANQPAPAEQTAPKTEQAEHKKPDVKKEDKEIVLDGTPTTLLKEEQGRTILSIEGVLMNKTDKTLSVPVLQAQALNAKGKVVKEWIIPIITKEMDPGQRQSFSYSMPFSEQGVVDIAFHFL